MNTEGAKLFPAVDLKAFFLKAVYSKVLFGSFGALFICLGSGAAVQSVDPQARAALIGKLTGVYLNLAPSDVARGPVTLRLADLHSERARVEALEENNKGCLQCSAGVEDRKKALGYYQEVLANLKDSSRFRVHMQIGHLNEILGKEKEAVQTFEALLKSEAPEEFKAEASLALGEFYYRRNKFALAKPYFEALSTNIKAGSQGLAAYRAAWCELNMGRQPAAVAGMKKILQNPRLLSRNSSAEDSQIDRQFHEEVSRDYVTFIARGASIPSDAAQEVFDLSPEATRIANIVYLASETERLGQRAQALSVWRMALQKQTSALARLESQVHITNLEMLLGNRGQANKDFEAALRLWPAIQPCADPELCKELKSRMKGFLVEWNKAEAQKPSVELLASYQLYLETFAEADVAIWAAKVAGTIKDYVTAFNLYSKAAKFLSVENKLDQKEVALTGAMEAAELSQQVNLREQAYEQYLVNSSDKKREVEVRYQRAKMIYDSGDYGRAAAALKEVALLSGGGSEQLKKQAADLSLDALAILQKGQKTAAQADLDLEDWSKLYAQKFPASAAEFHALSRTAVLNQVSRAGLSEAGADLAWSILQRFDLSQSEPKDLVVYYKNRLVLAEKLKKFYEARDASDRLLQLNGVSAEDRNYALSRKAWLSELVLDFDGALSAAQKMSDNKTPDYWLKLALYAELAGKDPQLFYREYLKVSGDAEKKALIAAELVKVAPENLKAQELEKVRSSLTAYPEILARLVLDIYVAQKDEKFLRKYLAIPAVTATATGKVLERSLLLDQYQKVRAEILGHKLDASTEKKMTAGLRRRVALLEEVEKLAGAAVKSADWSGQLLSLDLLGKESERFYQELMALPVPAGLQGDQEQQYLQALAQQSSPYQVKAADIGKKMTEFWSNEKAVEALNSDLSKSSGALEKMLKREYELVAAVAPEATKSRFSLAGASPQLAAASPQVRQEVEAARKMVRENPLSVENLQGLLKVEKNLGNLKMVTYLEGRLHTLSQPPERKIE